MVMNVQYIHDSKGNPTGVFIPLEEWNSLKEKFSGLDEEVANGFDIPEWHKEILDERLKDYENNPDELLRFDSVISDLRKKYS